MTVRSFVKSVLPDPVVARIADYLEWRTLPEAARAALRADRAGLPSHDPGPAAVNDAVLGWLAAAQDRSASQDGGVARHFSLLTGWAVSYPETTGYIVPTLLDVAAEDGRADAEEWRGRVRRMVDWLLAIQLADGAFQGGTIVQTPVRATTFNTGQILLGLAAAAAAFGDEAIREATRRAAQWLVDSQDEDGCWRRFPSPFAKPGEKAYETHVSWGLFEADRVLPGQGFGDAGLRQVRWALTKQQANGWFSDCDLEDPTMPLTHTIGYVLRGVLEAHRWSEDDEFLAAARRTAEPLLGAIDGAGRIAGRLDAGWRPAVDWICLTGTVQIAHCWLMLYAIDADERYLAAARRANALVRRTVRMDGDADRRGGVRGSFPVTGDYGRFEYLNWAAKFLIDSNRLELKLTR